MNLEHIFNFFKNMIISIKKIVLNDTIIVCTMNGINLILDNSLWGYLECKTQKTKNENTGHIDHIMQL